MRTAREAENRVQEGERAPASQSAQVGERAPASQSAQVGERAPVSQSAQEGERARFSIIGHEGALTAAVRLEEARDRLTEDTPELKKLFAAKAEEANFRLENLFIAQAMEKSGKSMEKIKRATGWERDVNGDGKWRTETDDRKSVIRQEGLAVLQEGGSTTLGMLIHDEELFNAYPDLKELDVVVIPSEEPENGYYVPGEIGIKLDEGTNETLRHEIQHAIQEREGFARGGNPGFFLKEGEKADDTDKSIAYFKYKSIAGEVEARNAVRRMKMSPEEKKRSLLQMTADIFEGDRIFIEEGLSGKREESRGIRFSLCEFEDHTRFVDLQTDQHLFDGLSEQESVDLAKRIIHDRFSGQVIGIDNPVYVNGVGAGEYSHPAKPIEDRTVKTAKMKASAELDNLVDAGNRLPDEPDGRDGHTHAGAIDGFSYLKTIFKVGDEFYEGLVNIINNKKGKLFKDVTQIKNITKAIADSYGKNPKFAFLRDVSMRSNVTADSEKSSGENENVRFSVSQTERTDNGLERTQTDSVRFSIFNDSEKRDKIITTVQKIADGAEESWEINKPDAIGEVSTQSNATQYKPTFSRQELGAGLNKIIAQISENANMENENVRFSVSPEEKQTDNGLERTQTDSEAI